MHNPVDLGDTIVLWEDARGTLHEGRTTFAQAMLLARHLAPNAYRVAVVRFGVVIWLSYGR
jgi:hypothetical protein